MYVILAVMILTTVMLFYAAKASVKTTVDDDGNESTVLSSEHTRWIVAAKWLVILTGACILFMYVLSIKFVNANYSTLFDTTKRFYVEKGGDRLDVYNVELTPEVGFFDYMFHPMPVKDSLMYHKADWSYAKVKSGKTFTGKMGSHGYGPKLSTKSTLSDKMNNQNESTRASQNYIMTTEKIPDAKDLWNNGARTFDTPQLGTIEVANKKKTASGAASGAKKVDEYASLGASIGDVELPAIK
jgi:hypothetical protein